MKTTLIKIIHIILLAISILTLTGFGEKEPKGFGLKNNGPSLGYSGNSASYIQIAQQLPSVFNCTLPAGSSDLMCEVCNCVHENGNEPPEGRIAVNRVVYTRAVSGHYPESICGVIRQPWQFSWYNKGTVNWRGDEVLTTVDQRVKRCIQTSADSQQYIGKWFASNYYNPSIVSPDWASGCRAFVNIGNHRFATGGCYGVRPNTTFIEQNQPATSWLEELFGVPIAYAGTSPVDDFLKKNNQYKIKDNYSNEVQKHIGDDRTPGSIEGDFNGDGKADFVSILVKDNKHFMMFFISQNQGFVTKAKPIPSDGVFYLSKINKEKVKVVLPNKQPRDIAQLEVFMGPTEGFYVEQNKVLRFKGQLKF